MKRSVVLRSPAEGDVEDVHRFLERTQLGLGNRFLIRLADLLERLESAPEQYGVVLQDVRAVRVRDFRYVVYYVVFPTRVDVIAVLHGSQNETAWQARR